MLNVLVIYDPWWYQMCTVKDYIDSFYLYSRFNIFYHQAGTVLNHKVSNFQVVVVHWSVRVCYENLLEYQVRSILCNFSGLRVLFVQDEYELTGGMRTWIQSNGIHTIFTVVPDKYIKNVFGEEIANEKTILNVLTGYVPIYQSQLIQYIKPLDERQNVIVYRGRNMGYEYGSLMQEKVMIGEAVKKYAEHNDIISDIEIDEEERIYGDKWYAFLGNSIGTLGTESGSNIFCFHGEVRNRIREYLSKNPDGKFEDVYDNVLSKIESRICKMNQISPKIFEAASLKVCLILFEGDYSGVLIPNKHYFPLKKDFSNLPDVFSFLNDYDKVNEMVECTYSDIICAHEYSYKNLTRRKGSAELKAQASRRARGRRVTKGDVP